MALFDETFPVLAAWEEQKKGASFLLVADSPTIRDIDRGALRKSVPPRKDRDRHSGVLYEEDSHFRIRRFPECARFCC